MVKLLRLRQRNLPLGSSYVRFAGYLQSLRQSQERTGKRRLLDVPASSFLKTTGNAMESLKETEAVTILICGMVPDLPHLGYAVP